MLFEHPKGGDDERTVRSSAKRDIRGHDKHESNAQRADNSQRSDFHSLPPFLTASSVSRTRQLRQNVSGTTPSITASRTTIAGSATTSIMPWSVRICIAANGAWVAGSVTLMPAS